MAPQPLKHLQHKVKRVAMERALALTDKVPNSSQAKLTAKQPASLLQIANKPANLVQIVKQPTSLLHKVKAMHSPRHRRSKPVKLKPKPRPEPKGRPGHLQDKRAKLKGKSPPLMTQIRKFRQLWKSSPMAQS